MNTPVKDVAVLRKIIAMEVFSDPVKDYTYRLFAEYYDNMTLTKVRDDDNKFSIYMARLPCLLLNEQRFLIAVMALDRFPPSYQKPLADLRWVSLQVRNLEEELPLPVATQPYTMKRTPDFQRRLRVLSRTSDVTTYTIDDLPIRVSLLHSRGQEYEYPNEGTLVSALETFRTILHF